MEKSWSHRVEQWAAFGRLGSCVNTSMLCERFHKTLKHDILGGKANMERGVEEGRYRLQRHHKAHAWAVKRYSERQQRVAVVGPGKWEVEDKDKVFHVQEHYCPCDEKFNNHCLRGECKACPYAFACNCTMDVKSGISCTHVHAALLYAPSGRRTVAYHQDAESSHANDDQFREERCSSDDEDEIVVVDIVDEPEN
ncbi:hypothetical protein ANCCAN_30390, partial [Ancylostoma caninum]